MELLFTPVSSAVERIDRSVSELNHVLEKIVRSNHAECKKQLEDSGVFILKAVLQKNFGVNLSYHVLLLLHKEVERLCSSTEYLSLPNENGKGIRDELLECNEKFFQMAIAVLPKYKVSPSEYYKMLEGREFASRYSRKATLYYTENLILRFWGNDRLLIIPFEEILKIHIRLGHREELGKITLTQKNKYGIYFLREYERWRGVGKDEDWMEVKYRLDPDTLELDRLKD
jgi:hypothetical protein